MKILMGTKNPGKIEGAKRAFEEYFENVEIIGVDVDSEVGSQPVNQDVFQGAKNRVKNVKKYAKDNNIEADYYIASEGGITNLMGEWIEFNAACIENKDGVQCMGTSQGFEIPKRYVDEIIATNLGTVMDKLFIQKDCGKGKGGISFLTRDVLSRIDLTYNAFVMALIKFNNENIWD